MDIEPLKLFQELKRPGFHSSIATTYSVDGAFYDGPIQRTLRRFECLNNILIADVSMLSRALSANPETFAVAGQRYAIVPARVRGCFHPKILLRLGRRKARLVVGSANVTAAAWGVNLEIAGCFDYGNGDGESAAAGPLISRAYNYLRHWLEPVPGDAMAHKLRLHRKESPWLGDVEPNEAPVTLQDGTAADLLCEFGDGRPGIMHRLVALVDGERVRQLVVVSPYWDDDVSALGNLWAALGVPATTIGVHPFAPTEFPVAAAKKEWNLRFAAVPVEEGVARFLHAKVFVVSTDKADHVVFGSANCSDAALGAVGRGGTNAEMSVYRRLPPGTALPMLGIDLSREIEPNFQPPERDPFVGGAGRILAGQVEATGNTVRWWPAAGIRGDGARLLAGSEEHAVLRGGGIFSASLECPPTFPMVVRFRLADGRVTEPTLVHECQRLFRSSPGTVDGKTLRMFRDVEEGKADLIDLAQRASQLFAPNPERPRGGGERTRPEPESQTAMPYATSEEFRDALELPTGAMAGPGGRFATSDPTLLQLLRIVMRGIVDVPDPGDERAIERESEREQDKRLKEGEKEDGDEKDVAEDGAGDTDGPGPETAPPQPAEPQKDATEKEFYTAEAIKHRRRYLMKALSKFDRMLQHLAKDAEPVDDNLAAQATFIFSLMSYAVRHQHRLESGSSRTLMTFEPTSGSRESSFVIRAAQMLRAIWVGQGITPPIASRMSGWKEMPLPQDLGIFMVMSRWVMARAHGAAAKCRSKELFRIVGKVAVQVFSATARFTTADPADEERLVRRLDASVGFMPVETDDLLTRMRGLRASTPGVDLVSPQPRPAPRRAVVGVASRG